MLVLRLAALVTALILAGCASTAKTFPTGILALHGPPPREEIARIDTTTPRLVVSALIARRPERGLAHARAVPFDLLAFHGLFADRANVPSTNFAVSTEEAAVTFSIVEQWTPHPVEAQTMIGDETEVTVLARASGELVVDLVVHGGRLATLTDRWDGGPVVIEAPCDGTHALVVVLQVRRLAV